MSTKLDTITAREWEETKANLTKPSLENLNKFLKDRADLLESLENSKSNKKYDKSRFESRRDNKTKSFVTSKACCTFCKGEHYIQDCAEFLQLDVNDRIENVKKLRLCINCLRTGHMVKQCRSSSCRNCKSRYNSLLHLESPAKKVDSTEETKAESVNLSSQHLSHSKQVLLSTVLVI
ncbi:hypothetical protein NQ317_007688 [Molorchus minor]|uniref:CCHC-type domain-containing protein n=1 Tax=Molorchus minor TaxID=1323400 RepID=A0ABQ9JNG6_9CUCU|nr:hypothetical protein NQ317_007688 [Molorchus minor]